MDSCETQFTSTDTRRGCDVTGDVSLINLTNIVGCLPGNVRNLGERIWIWLGLNNLRQATQDSSRSYLSLLRTELLVSSIHIAYRYPNAAKTIVMMIIFFLFPEIHSTAFFSMTGASCFTVSVVCGCITHTVPTLSYCMAIACNYTLQFCGMKCVAALGIMYKSTISNAGDTVRLL